MQHKQTTTQIQVPKGTRIIEKCQYYRSNIEVIHIPDSVEVIGESAFENCTNLKYIYFNKKSSKLKVIKRDAFRGCYNVKGIELPNHRVKIQNNALNFMDEPEDEFWSHSKTIKYAIYRKEIDRRANILRFCFQGSNYTIADAKRANRPHWFR